MSFIIMVNKVFRYSHTKMPTKVCQGHSIYSRDMKCHNQTKIENQQIDKNEKLKIPNSAI